MAHPLPEPPAPRDFFDDRGYCIEGYCGRHMREHAPDESGYPTCPVTPTERAAWVEREHARQGLPPVDLTDDPWLPVAYPERTTR